ncbi:MAG: hypothetical protein JOZ75_02130 [Candidatus Dormibacteraeota bacterium]|nr:hypothetical protein [Candidatus Dormibacteraeota bacterium]
MVAIVVLSAVFAILVIAFVWFFFYSRTLAWGESETRQAFLRVMVVIGPMFGVRYKEPRPEPPTIATPAKEEEPPLPGIVLPPAKDE